MLHEGDPEVIPSLVLTQLEWLLSQAESVHCRDSELTGLRNNVVLPLATL